MAFRGSRWNRSTRESPWGGASERGRSGEWVFSEGLLCDLGTCSAAPVLLGRFLSGGYRSSLRGSTQLADGPGGGHRVRDRRPEEADRRQAAGSGGRAGPAPAPAAEEDQEVARAGLPRGEQGRPSRAPGRLRPVRGGLPHRRREAPGGDSGRGVPPRELPAGVAVCERVDGETTSWADKGPDFAFQGGADGGSVSGCCTQARTPEVYVVNLGWIWVGRTPRGR
jgi:hypothetical protein